MTSRIALQFCWLLAVVMGFGACDTAASPRDAAGIEDSRARDGVADVLADAPDGAVSMCMTSIVSWQTTVALEHADCVSRTITDCQGTEPAFALPSKLLGLATETCRLPHYYWVRVEFEAGCPATLSVQPPSQTPVDELVACLTAALSTQRWRCALDIGCALAEWDTLAVEGL